MMYILTKEEYEELLDKKSKYIEQNKKKLQTLCTKIADEMPIKWGWGSPDPKPWGCVLTKNYEWYCDQCPVKDICPNSSKSWSK